MFRGEASFFLTAKMEKENFFFIIGPFFFFFSNNIVIVLKEELFSTLVLFLQKIKITKVCLINFKF